MFDQLFSLETRKGRCDANFVETLVKHDTMKRCTMYNEYPDTHIAVTEYLAHTLLPSRPH